MNNNINQIEHYLNNNCDKRVKVSYKNSDRFFHRQYDYYKNGIKLGSAYYDSFGDLCDAIIL